MVNSLMVKSGVFYNKIGQTYGLSLIGLVLVGPNRGPYIRNAVNRTFYYFTSDIQFKSGLYSQGVQTLAFAAIAFAAIVGTRSHHQFRILGGNLGYLIDSK